ncbi:MAG: hypothetical protein A3I05_00515 [Deltaproteobacteria bacterium RIFCSPLOWO2_02_FULL_44_10]|nr:MAG: hypothetical protein A3C46_01385 [Deltaproteobacteria bacterium RIFCSPHIGHO2_02_FULL_44_16]OGQ47286.1 MAG: hypothetical protein A3I05_00515 [Deltaproteobacteria bacterium RIFCSPLOWO2_02_FULL_44_10]
MKRLSGLFVALSFLFSAPLFAATSTRVFTFHSGSDPDSLDPHLTSTVDGRNLFLQHFEGLLAFDHRDNSVKPGVAKRWTVSPDGRIYTFYLREAKWSDGTKITAHDFVYAWKRCLDPKTGCVTAARFDYLKNGRAYNAKKITDVSQVGFRAIDDMTLELTLETPFPPILELLTSPTYSPLKKDVVQKFGDKWTEPSHIVSNGPFVLKEYRIQDRIIFTKNPTYWDKDNVNLDEVHAHLIEDLETALKQFQAGELDYIYQVPQTKAVVLQSDPLYHASPSFGTYYYPVNTKHPVLKDARVRRALAYAIDRQTIVEKILRTGEKPAYGVIPPGVQGYTYKKYVDFDPAVAKKLLAEAGYPDGKGFPTLTLSYNTLDLHKLMAQTVQQMWREHLGINVVLQNHEWKVHIKSLQSHSFEIARLGGIGEYIYPSGTLEEKTTQSPDNYAQFSNAEYDRTWEMAGKETDPKKRLQLYAELEAILMNEMPDIPLFFYKNEWMTKSHVTGLSLSPMKSFNLKYVSLNGKR